MACQDATNQQQYTYSSPAASYHYHQQQPNRQSTSSYRSAYETMSPTAIAYNDSVSTSSHNNSSSSGVSPSSTSSSLSSADASESRMMMRRCAGGKRSYDAMHEAQSSPPSNTTNPNDASFTYVDTYDEVASVKRRRHIVADVAPYTCQQQQQQQLQQQPYYQMQHQSHYVQTSSPAHASVSSLPASQLASPFALY